MKLNRIQTASGPCDYWIGGRGSPMLLVHGGWAGAEAHWGPVWTALSGQHMVIAIELPGIWRDFETALGSYHDYAKACADLLFSLGLKDVAVVGNSLGASVGWQLALDCPDLVRHLIVVNGFPPNKLPMRRLLGIPRLQSMALRSLIANFYSPAVFKTAFHNPAYLPESIRDNLSGSGAEMATVMFRLLYSVTRPAGPLSTRLDFIWGEQDCLPKVRLADGRKLCSANPASRLFPIPHAGHLPQIENPLAFIAAMTQIVSDNTEGR